MISTRLKRAALLGAALILGGLYIAPSAIAAYSTPVTLTGDCSKALNSSNVVCSKFNNGTSFGSMAGQSASVVAITGGAIDNTPIGATTPSTGNFTSITSSGPVTSAGEVGASQTITAASDTIRANVSFVCVNNSTAPVAVAGKTTPIAGDHYTLKDCSGTAATNNITYTPGSGITVDGAATYVLNNPRQAINVWFTSATSAQIY